MQQQLRGDGTKSRTSRSSRSSSVGSDAVPPPVVTSLRIVPAAKPTPAYVAAAAASELVTNNHQLALQEDAYDLASPPSPDHQDGALFSSGGLATINAFLDQLLFNFLVQARGTTLAALRQSVEQVLKGKLAAYAISSADEELEELLNDDELDENLAAVQESASGSTKGDIEAIFWRTRLRVMVYMRLGELEDEDEERYVEEAQVVLHKDSSRKRLSLNTGLVSWAAAIFLTSILEFIAEQCLNVAGQAALDRIILKRRNKADVVSDEEERIIVEEYDTEKIALSSTLGRLWRTWRKGLRSPHSRNASASLSHSSSRKHSTSAIRAELLGRQHIDSYSRNGNEKACEGNIAIRAALVGGGAPSRGKRVSAASDEGARVNAVRIYRLSHRPRSLVIDPPRQTDRNRVSRDMLAHGTQQQGSLQRIRSRSLPNPGRISLTSPNITLVPGSDRPRTAPKPVQSNTRELQTEKPTVQKQSDLHGDYPSREQAETDTYEVHENLSTYEFGPSDPSYAEAGLDAASPTSKLVPGGHDSRSQSSEAERNPLATQTSVGSRESFTSIEEDVESQAATSSAEIARDAPNGLGIHSTSVPGSSKNAPIPPVAAYYEPPLTSGLVTRSAPRSPPHNEQQAVRSVKSFEREEKSSVRRLSNSSSKHSKSNSSAKHQYPTKPSLETLSSPPSGATSRSGYFEKGFGDFVAGEETVKYTLTPRTLQAIESPDSPRYKEKELARNKDQNRKQNLSDEDLAAAQKAVIASMNASLRNYSPSNEHRWGVVSPMSVSLPSTTPPVPPVPRSLVPHDENMQHSNYSGKLRLQTETKDTYDDYPHSATLSQPKLYTQSSVNSKQQRKTPQANQSSGWFSGRSSMESSRAAKANGSMAPKKPSALLQPREAVVGRRGENDDLVAFLRSTGPPGVQVDRGPDRPLTDSNTVSTASRTSHSTSRSTHDPTNSYSGLLSSNMLRGQGGRNVSESMQEDESGPPRTRKRIKDPYALPSDDDDDIELTALPRSKSETLMDFLRNVEPPPSMIYANGTSPKPRASPRDLNESPDLRYLSGSMPPSPSSPQGKGMKGKGNMKSFLKKIGT